MQKIVWDSPLLFSFESLPPVSLSECIIPKYNDNFVGMDIISQHTIFLSSKGGQTDIRIFPSEYSEEVYTITKSGISGGSKLFFKDFFSGNK
jgi:hypothetical protein